MGQIKKNYNCFFSTAYSHSEANLGTEKRIGSTRTGLHKKMDRKGPAKTALITECKSTCGTIFEG